MLLVLWAIASILFLLFRLMPGDPTTAYLDRRPSPTNSASVVLQQFGLDLPLWRQYADLHRQPAARRFRSLVPAARAGGRPDPGRAAQHAAADAERRSCIAYIFGILGGALLALKRGAWVEAADDPAGARHARGAGVLARHAAAGGVRLRLRLVPDRRRRQPPVPLSLPRWHASPRPTSGGTSCCPPLTLTLYLQGLPLLLMRANMLEVMNDEFIIMARMKGLSRVVASCSATPRAMRCCRW